MIHLRRFLQSVHHALRGVVLVFRHEQSFRLQMIGAFVVVVLGIWLSIRPTEWIVILLLIGAVLCLEIINSIFERLVDVLKPRLHPDIRDMKDLMAGCVLVVSLVALGSGAVIFIPKLIPIVEEILYTVQ